jgi:hypothetical protein
LNNHLMRTLYEQNGWDTSNMAKFSYADIEEVSLEDYSKAVQRIFSTSAIEVDRPVLNRIRVLMGVEPKGDDEPVDKDALPVSMAGVASNAGDGMAVGTTGQGTAKKPVAEDSSTGNKEN